MQKEQMQANLSRQKEETKFCHIKVCSFRQNNKYCIGLYLEMEMHHLCSSAATPATRFKQAENEVYNQRWGK